MRRRQCGRLSHRRPACPVRVENQEQLVGEAFQKPDLVLGQGGARAGHGVAYAELVGGDDVELPFDQCRIALVGNLISGQVQAEDHASFYVGWRIG